MRVDHNPLDSLAEVLSFSPRDWGQSSDLAWVYGIVCGWSEDAMSEIGEKFNWGDGEITKLKILHAAFVAANQ